MAVVSVTRATRTELSDVSEPTLLFAVIGDVTIELIGGSCNDDESLDLADFFDWEIVENRPINPNELRKENDFLVLLTSPRNTDIVGLSYHPDD